MAFSIGFSRRLDDQRPGIGRRDRADLVDGRRRAVVFDLDAVEHLRVRAARADGAEIRRQNLQSFLHFALKLLQICHNSFLHFCRRNVM